MRDYAKIVPVFWTRGSGRALRGNPIAQVLAFYLFTSPHTGMCGLFYLPVPTIIHETGLDADDVREGLAALSRLDIAHHDEANDLFYLPAGARTQMGPALSKQDKRWKGLRRDLQSFSDHRFYVEFLRKYGDAFELREDLEAAELALAGSPFEAPSKPLRSQDQDQEQEQEQEHPLKPPKGGVVSLVSSPESEPAKPRRPAKPAPQSDPDAVAVFDAYLAGWLTAKRKGTKPVLDANRARMVRARLADGFSLDDLKTAAAAIWRSDWHRENNKLGFHLAMRDAEAVEKCLGFVDRPSQSGIFARPAGPTMPRPPMLAPGPAPSVVRPPPEALAAWRNPVAPPVNVNAGSRAEDGSRIDFQAEPTDSGVRNLASPLNGKAAAS